MDDFDATIRGLEIDALKELLEAKEEELKGNILKHSGNALDKIKGQISLIKARIKEGDVVRKQRAAREGMRMAGA